MADVATVAGEGGVTPGLNDTDDPDAVAVVFVLAVGDVATTDEERSEALTECVCGACVACWC